MPVTWHVIRGLCCGLSNTAIHQSSVNSRHAGVFIAHPSHHSRLLARQTACMYNHTAQDLSCPLVNIPSPHSPPFNAQICALKRSKIVAGWVAAGSAWKLYHVPQTPLAGQGRGKVKRKEENEWSRDEGKIRFVGFRWTDDGRHDWDCVQSRACSNQFIIATSRVANTPLKYHILRHSLVTSRTHCKYFK